MVAQIDSIIDTVRRYIAELEKHHIPVSQAILYGSYANGRVRQESDIDVALVSEAFTGDRYEDRRRICTASKKDRQPDRTDAVYTDRILRGRQSDR